MQEDICPLTRLRIYSESITITAVLPSRLFPSPQYYRDVCPRYRHYRCKICSVVPVTAVLPQITTVLPLSQLPCSSLILYHATSAQFDYKLTTCKLTNPYARCMSCYTSQHVNALKGHTGSYLCCVFLIFIAQLIFQNS